MKKDILVSIIVPTKNSEKFLEACLKSIKSQTYKKIEIIVVDNYSTDHTKRIALKYTDYVFDKGPERSAQRNYGARKSSGNYLLFIDSDMELSPKVVEDCVKAIVNKEIGGIIIPEISFGEGFWAKCKALEKSFYEGTDIEAARFYPKKVYWKIGGYNESLISGEDWDLSKRVGKNYLLERIKEKILHNEGKLTLILTIKKKYYYTKSFAKYLENNQKTLFTSEANPLKRYILFLSNPKKLLANPLVGFGMLFMKSIEYCVGVVAFILK